MMHQQQIDRDQQRVLLSRWPRAVEVADALNPERIGITRARVRAGSDNRCHLPDAGVVRVWRFRAQKEVWARWPALADVGTAHGVHAIQTAPLIFVRDIGVMVREALDPLRARDARQIRLEGADRGPVDDLAVECHAGTSAAGWVAPSLYHMRAAYDKPISYLHVRSYLDMVC